MHSGSWGKIRKKEDCCMSENRKLPNRSLIVSIAIPLLVGGVASFFTRAGVDEFEAIAQPPFAPPEWLFLVVSAILYVLMGVAAHRIWLRRDSDKTAAKALRLYALQLFFNFIWSFLFFNQKNYIGAFVWLVFLWALILLTIDAFYKIDKRAAYLMIPYALWVTFAGYLNLGLALLNK